MDVTSPADGVCDLRRSEGRVADGIILSPDALLLHPLHGARSGGGSKAVFDFRFPPFAFHFLFPRDGRQGGHGHRARDGPALRPHICLRLLPRRLGVPAGLLPGARQLLDPAGGPRRRHAWPRRLGGPGGRSRRVALSPHPMRRPRALSSAHGVAPSAGLRLWHGAGAGPGGRRAAGRPARPPPRRHRLGALAAPRPRFPRRLVFCHPRANLQPRRHRHRAGRRAPAVPAAGRPRRPRGRRPGGGPRAVGTPGGPEGQPRRQRPRRPDRMRGFRRRPRPADGAAQSRLSQPRDPVAGDRAGRPGQPAGAQ